MKTTSRFAFLWKSVNAHGLHSPFVYQVADKCFYRNISHLKYSRNSLPDVPKEAVSILEKIITGLKPVKLYVPDDPKGTATALIREIAEVHNQQVWFFSPMAPVPGTIDLAYFSAETNTSLPQLLNRINAVSGENSACIVGDIRKTPEAEAAWYEIINQPEATVSIDLYSVGLVFFRPGQAKQHFLVRPCRSFWTDALLGVKNLWGLLG
ncbi:hypothetical protein [Flavobacterium coralii]|uniref:hypothetical protein n=1 Tax=Flavobacterium coralii TaxID=2838017 RepID=UPI0026BAB694|tara:strand:- start:14960 stop:15586 length:627 start_codon:yes stop_codon:yes gene_type:complete